MSDAIKHLDLDSEEFEDAPKAVRDYAKSLKKQLESVTKERDGVRTQLASSSLEKVLADKAFKNPAKVQKDILRDGVDPLDSEAVEAWLADNSDDYAKGTQETPAAENSVQKTDQQIAFEQIAGVQSGSTNPAILSKWDLVQAEITDDMDGPAVAALYKKHGI